MCSESVNRLNAASVSIPRAEPGGEHWVGVDGHYRPYDFWLSMCGIYDLYAQALDILGNIEGKQVLDCGVGRGHTSVMLAKRGARVTAFDTSESDLVIARELAAVNGVNVEHSAQAFETLSYESAGFDLLFGAFILHHVDLELAGPEIDRVLKPGGRAVFIENSNRNPALMLARKSLCGRFGIPKYGDDEEEHPLNQTDVRSLERSFNGRVLLHFPSLVFFRLLDFYVFRKRSRLATSMLENLDLGAGAIAPPLRRYSYFQIVELVKPVTAGTMKYTGTSEDTRKKK